MGKLTAVEVDNITTVGRHADSGGLYLEVDKKGAKRWLYRYQLYGKRTWYGLGGYHKKTNNLAIARASALEAKSLVNRGLDPVQHSLSLKAEIEESRKAKEKEKLANQYTFEVGALTGKKTNKNKSNSGSGKDAQPAVRALQALGDLEAKGAISAEKANRLRTAIIEDF